MVLIEVEDMESESSQLDHQDIPDVTGQLLLPVVVLRKVFENLSNADLLNLSLVNKVWNYETRSVLRDRGSLTVKMNTSDGRCKDMRDFASDLLRMREVRKIGPFSGMTIAINEADDQNGDWCKALSTGELDQVCEDILHQMQWKHLALRLSHGWDRKENCAGFMLMKKVLHNNSCVLEEFSLNISELSEDETSIQHFLQDCNFPSLKTLKIQGRYNAGRDEDFIKGLVSRAPNLKVLYTDSTVDLEANILEGTSAYHVHDARYYLPSNPDRIPDSVLGRLRLPRLYLLSFNDDFDLERFNRMVPILLRNSRTTLRLLNVEAMLLTLLMHYGICLENVMELKVTIYDVHTDQPRLRRLLKSFDFSIIFPNLRSVQIGFTEFSCARRGTTSDAVIAMVEQGNNATFIEPVNRSVNINRLCLEWEPDMVEHIPDVFTRFLIEMFPHVQKLSIEGRQDFLVRFWDYWSALEELDVEMPFSSNIIENLDSIFCGIFPEEVAELQQRDEEYLRSVNIVPVMPSLSCLKRLRTFTVYFDESISFNIDPTFVLSKVTGLIAFKRCSDLTVNLETSSERLKQELLHMEPYASVRQTEPRRSHPDQF